MRRVRGHDLEAGDEEDVKPLVRSAAPGRSYSPPVHPPPAPKRSILLYLIIFVLCLTLFYSHSQIRSKESDIRNLETKYHNSITTAQAAHEEKLKATVAEVESLKAEKEDLAAKAESDYQQLKSNHIEAQDSLTSEIVRRYFSRIVNMYQRSSQNINFYSLPPFLSFLCRNL
jgi:hypothetical protein